MGAVDEDEKCNEINRELHMDLLDFSSEEKCEEYENFVSNFSGASFMQSLKWCGVKRDWKHEAVIIRDDSDKIIATMLVLIKNIPMLKTALLYAPRGPVCDLEDKDVILKLVEGVSIIARKYNAFMFKIDPFVLDTDDNFIEWMKSIGFRFTPKVPETHTVQSRCNYILKIKNKSIQDVFDSFHSKWRYNIRLAERKGVVCGFYGPEKIDDFYKLMEETGKRQNFTIRSKDYFVNMLEKLKPFCRLYMCYYEGKPASGAIAIQYAGTTSYVYGAHNHDLRNVMPNHLMQWTMIKWAIENKNDVYDFQGIPFYFDENHPNFGVYQFKKGFNGEVVEYAGEFDYVFSNRLRILVELLRQWKVFMSKTYVSIKRMFMH